MSTTANSIPVTVDDKIRNQPELRKAVELATAYFLDMYLQLPSDPEWNNAKLRWDYIARGTAKIKKPESDGDHVRVLLVEEERVTGRYEVYEDIPVHRMFDEYGRESHMRRLHWSVSSYRTDVIQARLNKLIIELEEESENGV